MRYLCPFLLIFAACTASTPSKTKQAPVPPTTYTLTADQDVLSDVRFASRYPVAGTDGTVAMAIPGPLPGRIVHANPATGLQASIAEGALASDAPLRFLGANGIVRAESFDGSLIYEAHERVTEAAPWSAEPGAARRCCGWWERTIWRAAPGALSAGLLRAVILPQQKGSVLDWHVPGAMEPAWRLQLTEGFTNVVTAAVSPAADQIVAVLSDVKGKAIVRALATKDGRVLWTTQLDQPAANWWNADGSGRMAYSFNGARFAVLMDDLARCETCSAIAVFDSATGKHIRTVAVNAIMSPEFSSVGLSGNTVWIFEHVTPKQTDMSRRPERCQYEVHDLSTGARRSMDQTAPEWGFPACTTWALLPRFGKDGVVGLGPSGPSTLTVLVADEAP